MASAVFSATCTERTGLLPLEAKGRACVELTAAKSDRVRFFKDGAAPALHGAGIALMRAVFEG
jgi:hypothetical protein